MNKLFLFLVFGFIFLSSLVYAFYVLVIANITPGGYCIEFEAQNPLSGGHYPPPGLEYGNPGYINGSFSSGLPSGVHLNDFCLNSNTLVEFVCGSSINPAYSQYAGAVLVQCGEPGVPGTQCMMFPTYGGAGACIP